MAKVCYVTGRKARSGNTRSHAMNATKRKFKANLQKVTILVDGQPKKVWVSARALKSGNVERVELKAMNFKLSKFYLGSFLLYLMVLNYKIKTL